MIVIKTPAEIDILRECNRIVLEVLDEVGRRVQPGVTTLELDAIAGRAVRRRGAEAAFKGYRGYPKSLCTSVNEEVVHGIPSHRRLREGDIVGIDFGVRYRGYCGDAARTVRVGRVGGGAARLIETAERALREAIAAAVPGNRVGDISSAIQRTAEAEGYSVIRDFVGHGIGRDLHEDPQIPNYAASERGPRLRPGMVLAIEPMIAAGGWEVEVAENGWTARTKDRSLSAHAEYSVAVGGAGPVVLGVDGGSV
ncbi:MAG: type I methionyl aminopeptidase [Deltaproteobacteria bacterium]|nr:type I methionyl aminopeptidase [Deltaproteobacteria bacterium]